MNQRADKTESTRVCSSNDGVVASAISDQMRKQPTGAGLRDELAGQVGLADESKSNKMLIKDIFR